MMRKFARITLLTFMISLVATCASVASANSTQYDINDVHMTMYQDHAWLFYRCGDNLYYNHELRNQRTDNGRTLSFRWFVKQSLIGLMYCDGYGFPLPGLEKVKKGSRPQTVSYPDKLYVFYQDQTASGRIRYTTLDGTVNKNQAPRDKKFKTPKYLTNNNGNVITADSYKVVQFGESPWVIYSKWNQIRVRLPNGRTKSIAVDGEVSPHKQIHASAVYTKEGPRLMVLWPEKETLTYKLSKIDFVELKGSYPRAQTVEQNFLPKANEAQGMNMHAELSGDVYLNFVDRGTRRRVKLDLERLMPSTFDVPEVATPFHHTESKSFGTFQMPAACNPNSHCRLFNTHYPLSAKFRLGPAQLFHLADAGRVVVEPLNTIPVKIDQMELVGIIEGPPPVPLENVLASLKVVPDEFKADAARRLSSFIRTNIHQYMTFKSVQTKEESFAKVHTFSGNGTIPAVTPMTIGGMAEITRKFLKEEETSREVEVKKSYQNEIQHASGNDKLIMRPIGKLIFLKFDIIAYKYVFQNSDGSINRNAPVMYSMEKTNVRPIIRPYEILGRQIKPNKYPNHFIVGDLQSYTNFHRRRALLNRAQELAPGHKFLSYTFNQVFDQQTNISIKTEKTFTSATTDTFTSEFLMGTGLEDVFGVNFSVKSTEERTYSVSNAQAEGMAINVDMRLVTPSDDDRVLFYDFEVFYLAPEERNVTELLEELRDTKAASLLNREIYEQIKPSSKPWKITYTVSDIRRSH